MEQVNFLAWRNNYRNECKKRLLTIIAAGTVFVIILMLLFRAFIGMETYFYKKRINTTKQNIANLSSQLKDVNSFTREKIELADRLKIIDTLKINRPEMVYLFEEIAQLIPKDGYLTVLSRNGDKIILSGKASSNKVISELMRNCETSLLISSASLKEVKTNPKDGQYPYSFLFHIKLKNRFAQLVGGGIEHESTKSTRSYTRKC